GDWISLDGATGRVFLGQSPTTAATLSGEFAEFMKWADAARTLKVRATADVPRDAKQARKFGAEGIGLCRTEHMFFAEDRLPWVVQMIMNAAQTKALREPLPARARRTKALRERLGKREDEADGADKVAAKKLAPEIAALRKQLAGPEKLYKQ